MSTLTRAIIFAGLFTVNNLFAQQDCWSIYSTQNSGIPLAQYTDVEILPSGEIIMGSSEGLIAYDGLKFEFLNADKFPLGSKHVNCIETLPSGVYVGTNLGYTWIDANQNAAVYLKGVTGLAGDTVRAVAEDVQGRIWVGTEQGLSIKTGLNWSYINTPDLPSRQVQDIEIMANGDVAVATNNGLTIISENSGSFTFSQYTRQGTSLGMLSDDVKALHEDASQNLWLASQYGISVFDGSNWTKYTVSNTAGLASNDIRGFDEDSIGNIYVATAFGLTTFSSGTVTHSYAANGLAENILSAVVFRSTDNAVFAVSNNPSAGSNNGLHIYNGVGWENYERENTGMPTNAPSRLIAFNDEMASGYIGGIFIRGNNTVQQLSTLTTNIPDNSIRDLSSDLQNGLWAVSSSGMSRWNGQSWTSYGAAQGLTSSYYLGAALTDSTFIVSNAFSTGVVYFDGTQKTEFKSFNTAGLATNAHRDLESMGSGMAAVATSAGLSVFDGTTFTLYNSTNSNLPGNDIKCLDFDLATNTLWMGHNNSTNGISVLDGATGMITNFSGASVGSAIKEITYAGDSTVYFISGSNYYYYDAKNDSLATFNSSNSPIASTLLNDIEYYNGRLWIATGNKLYAADDFQRTAVATTVGDPATCDLDSVVIMSIGNYSSITWNTGATSPQISTNTSATVSYVATDASGCSYTSNALDVTIFPNPIADLFMTNDYNFCLGENNVISTWDYFSTYNWSDGSTSDSVNVTDNGTFWVEVMDTNGCFATSDTISLNVWKPYQEDSICIVTVDTLNRNQLIWNKTTGVRIFEYGIYKENPVSGDFDQIATVPASGVLSVWSDPNSDAAITSSRYKISVIDSCGNESELSPQHKTMHLTINAGLNGEVNLIWDGYEGIDLTTYEVWRGSSPLQMFKIDDVPAANFTYTDLNAPVGLLFYKVVVVNPYVCSPTVGKNNDFEAYEATQSNIVDYAQTDNVIIYPNPWTSQTRVVWSNPDLDSYEIRIYDAVGRMVFFEADVAQTSYDLYQNDLPSGVYAIELTDGERLLKTDFIIE